MRHIIYSKIVLLRTLFDYTGVYSAGWSSTGPVGVILSTMTNSFAVGDLIIKDVETGKLDLSLKPGFSAAEALLKQRGIYEVINMFNEIFSKACKLY